MSHRHSVYSLPTCYHNSITQPYTTIRKVAGIISSEGSVSGLSCIVRALSGQRKTDQCDWLDKLLQVSVGQWWWGDCMDMLVVLLMPLMQECVTFNQEITNRTVIFCQATPSRLLTHWTPLVAVVPVCEHQKGFIASKSTSATDLTLNSYYVYWKHSNGIKPNAIKYEWVRVCL